MDNLIREPMASLEARLRELVRSRVEFIELIGDELVSAGGKRLRPALVFLACRALASEPHPGEVDLAAAVELLHSASLLHDDLVDDAETRRGSEAAFRHYGNAVSVLSGDFLLSRMLTILSGLPADLTRLMADTSRGLCEGEVLQFQLAALRTPSLEGYLEVVTGKTAVVFAAATRGAALLHAAPPAVADALGGYGLEYGRAFQMQDDLLDLTAEPRALGKPTGTDLRDGKATLPVLYLLEAGVAEVEGILGRRASQEGDVARMRALILEHGAAERARAEIRRRASAAVAHLQVLPASPARAALEDLAWSAADRVA